MLIAYIAGNFSDGFIIPDECMDNARDILSFLTRSLPNSSESFDPLPVHLPRISRTASRRRRDIGFSDRKLITLAHSMGGCST